MAAGTVTITEERLYNVKKVVFAWTAGTGAEEGTASGTTTYAYTGNLLKAVTVPGAGAAAPTDDYDITLTDEAGIDVANAQLLNRDETNTEWVVSSLGAVVGDKLTINVAAAGSANTGTCTAYIGLADSAAANVDVENALYGTTGIATFPSAAAPANNVSIAEVLRSVWAGLMGTAAGENGIATWPAAAAPANDVSIAEALRYTADHAFEAERHVHSYERWFGLAGTPDAEVHRGDAIGTTATAFQMDAGNNTWGAWLQILGSSDTPAVAGNVKFDLHKLMITDVERDAAIHFIQIAAGTSGAQALTDKTYTEFVFKPQAVNTEETPFEVQMRRQTAGTKIWARCRAVGSDTGTVDFFIGLHEYEA